MADRIIKPDSSNQLVLQDEGGSDALTVETDGKISIVNDLTIGADADGTDRAIVFGHSTIKSIIGIDDSGDVFVINTDASFEGTNDLEIDASGNITIGNGNLNMPTTKKIAQKGAFMQSSTHQVLFLGA